MSDQISYIASLCKALAEQGQQPSVALIKKKANQPLRLPLIISVLKKWKEDPDQLSIKANDHESAPPTQLSDHQRILALENRVLQLETALELLSKKLQGHIK